ncbi:hypothetical protein GPZ88_01220 [Streptococcus ruminicola]|uniref:Phage protein n=1 Tax=Streptococcus ruminicola TaxID=2686210 RepID=A0A6G8HYA1_9STRE|nr:hypothetical protein [Streptococcus ruminicola]QIM45758.1 hypothetical protein GPZ88_01220 [Streptococcus ruminicola]
MKQTQTFIVFRSKENGHFLMEYKNRARVLAFEAGWCKDINDAITTTEEAYMEDKEKYEGMLQMFNAEPLKVEAEYTFKTLDGKEPEEIEADSKPKREELADVLFDALFGGD